MNSLFRYTLALTALVVTGGAGSPALAQNAGTEVQIIFASGPDDTGTVRRLVETFNEGHRGSIRVEWREMERESDAHRRSLIADLASEEGGIDLMASDVVWTAELARNGWVEDVTDRLYDAFDRDALLAPARESAMHRLRYWGVPWYTDAGLLFFRRDLLAAAGFPDPPATWDELADMARRVKQESGVAYGLVFQGAQYEGGTVNAAEFIWSAGGDLITSRPTVTGLVVRAVTEIDSVKVGSAEAARGLDLARSLISDGIAPEAVIDFREEDALEAFARGDAVFMRSWPYAYALLAQTGFSAEQIGVAALPAATGGRSASALGGWNLMINASSTDSEREAAWQLLRFFTDPEQQRRMALEAGLLPILVPLYDDAELVAQRPVMALGREVFDSQLRRRPMSPFYSEISASIARTFQQVLRGELAGAEAVALLEAELRPIVTRNR